MKDSLFAEGDFERGSFRFNDEVASVFDDMAGRSIPFYREVINISGALAEKFLPENGTVYDIGCATGNTLIFLAKHLQGRNIRLIGYDPAEAMINKAREKSAVFTYSHAVEFKIDNCENCSLENADMVILNYTLQFIDRDKRDSVIKKIYDSLKPGGILLLSEKLRQSDKAVEEFNTETYESFKSGNGYSYLEIANKRQALEKVLNPDSLSGNLNLLERNGFSRIEILFKWLNFTTFAAFK